MTLTFDGQADDRYFPLTDASGNPVNPREVVCPIVKLKDGMIWESIGTGFFVAENGLFATAKHVLLEALDTEGNPGHQLYIIQWHPDGTYTMRNVHGFVVHSIIDVGVGFVWPMMHPQTGKPLLTGRLILTAEQQVVGEAIFTYAYPKTIVHQDPHPQIFFYPGYYAGRLEEYHSTGRDPVLLPYPCYRTSITLHGGSSGGPVVNSRGRVFAINSKSFEGAPDVSFVSRIIDILGLTLPSVSIGNTLPAPMLIFELARQGHLSFMPPLPQGLVTS